MARNTEITRQTSHYRIQAKSGKILLTYYGALKVFFPIASRIRPIEEQFTLYLHEKSLAKTCLFIRAAVGHSSVPGSLLVYRLLPEMEEFHQFSSLPKELRVLIWELASFPIFEPGAHFMTLAEDIQPEGHEGAPIRARWLDLFEESIPSSPPPLQSPRAGGRPAYFFDQAQANRCSWPSPLSSSCLLHYGLLAACRESRAAITRYMESHTPEPRGSASYRALPLGASPLLCNLAADLFVFRFANRHTVPGEGWYLHFKRQMGIPYRENVLNIALEFSTKWKSGILDMLREPFRTLTSVVSEARGAATSACSIWIVDYELPEDLEDESEDPESSKAAQPCPQPPRQFPRRFCSRDRAFVETFPARGNRRDSISDPSVFATVRLLQTWLRGLDRHSSSPSSAAKNVKIGVLRCQKLARA